MTEFAFIDELSGDSFEEDTSAKKTFPLMPEGEAFDMGTEHWSFKAGPLEAQRPS